MKHIGVKLFLGFFCMAVLTVLILWIVQAGIMRDSYLQQRVSRIDAAMLQAIDESGIDYQELEETLDISFITMDHDGTVQYISQGMPMRGMVIKSCHALAAQPDGHGLQIIETPSGSARYAVLVRALNQNENIYAVFSLTNVEEASLILRRQLWVVTFALIVFSVVLAVFLSGRFSRPIRDVTDAARSMAAGQLDISLPVRSKDEIGQLTVALNDLGKQLRITDNLRRELIANVSHELRAPLSVIRGFAETVRDVSWPYAEKRTEQLTIIADEAARLGQIVTDILDYSRLQSGVVKMHIADFPILAVLEKAVNRHALDAAQKNAAIELKSPDVKIRFDVRMFEQVLDNLLHNAVNYAMHDSTIFLSVNKTAAAYRVQVKNHGAAIAKEELAYIWDRYYRAESMQENQRLGTGLGLAIVKSILEMHKVSYGVASDDNGTVFWFDVQAAI